MSCEAPVFTRTLIGSPINSADFLIGSPITSYTQHCCGPPSGSHLALRAGHRSARGRRLRESRDRCHLVQGPGRRTEAVRLSAAREPQVLEEEELNRP